MPAPKGNFFTLVAATLALASAAGLLRLFLDTWPMVLFFVALLAVVVGPYFYSEWKKGKN